MKMMQQRLYRELGQVAARYRRIRLRVALTVVWLLAAGAGTLVLALDSRMGWRSPLTLIVLAGVTLVVAFVTGLIALRPTRDYRGIARRIEATHPDLEARLLAAIEQKPQFPKGRFGYLQVTLLREVLSHARGASWSAAIPSRRLALSQAAHLTAFALLAFVATRLIVYGDPQETRERLVLFDPGPVVAADHYQIEIEPGDTEIERGAHLLVMARFIKPLPENRPVPEDVTLVTQPTHSKP